MFFDPFTIVSSIAVLLFSLSVHESAHAWAANRLGDPTARDLGRISLNPLVHADLFGTFLFPLIGFFVGFIFGWAKPVPVNLANLQNPRRDHMLVAAAGPASNVVLAAGLFLTLWLLKSSSDSMALMVNQAVRGVGDGAFAPLMTMAYFGIVINLLLAIFNMLPVAPLDGAAVLSGLVPEPVARMLDYIQPFGFVILIGLLFLGVPSYLFSPVLGAVRSFLVF